MRPRPENQARKGGVTASSLTVIYETAIEIANWLEIGKREITPM